MKRTINIAIGVCLCLLIYSCEEKSITVPKAAMTISTTQLAINESMEIHFTGTADQVAIYTGDEMHDYDLRIQSNTGFIVNKGLFTYSYPTPGVYKVVCVASTYTDMAAELLYDTCSYTVTVLDDVTEIDKISCPQVLYDEVFAENIGNDEWAMRLPRKVKYNTASPSISLTQRLRFYIGSDSTRVFVNGNPFAATAKYDLSGTVHITVRSHLGTSRTYKLYTIYYPEFGSFKLSGVDGVLSRSEFDYSTMTMTVTVPAATDLSNLISEFTTTSASDKVFIGQTEQVSGVSEVDFTKDVAYKIVSTHTDKETIRAATTVNIKIVTK